MVHMLRVIGLSIVAGFVALVGFSAQAEPVKVIASIAPVHGLLAAVMEGVGSPQLLLEAQQSPHRYALKPSDARALADADLVVWVGPELESFLVRPMETLAGQTARLVLSEVPDMNRLGVRSGGYQDGPETQAAWIKRLKRNHAGALPLHDPHYWLDPVNAAIWVQAMADRLAGIDPAHASQYQANASRLVQQIKDIEARIQERLAPLASVRFAVFHDGYRYFESRFGLTSVGAITDVAEVGPSADRIRWMKRAIADQQVVCVFSEPQFPKGLVDAVIEGTRVRSAVLDPLGSAQALGPGHYLALLESMAQTFEACLGEGVQ